MFENRPLASPASTHILVLEDEVLILMDIESELIDRGHRVTAVSSVDQAASALDGEKIDLALLDVHLHNGATSFGIADRLTKMQIPVVFLTGSQGAGMPERLRHLGIVPKPFGHGWVEKALSAVI